MGDLLTFMQQAMGIQSSSSDPTNPIPPDATTGLYPGAYVTNSQIEIVGNNGTGNALAIPLSALRFTPTSNATAAQTINMPFSTIQKAAGESVSADMVVYDSLGTPLSVHLTAVLQDTTSTYTEYRWFADCGNNAPSSGVSIAVGTGLIRFDSSGNFLSATNDSVSIDRENSPAIKPLEFALNFGSLSGLATTSPSLTVSSQDGCAPGTLSSYKIGSDGTITGVYSNGVTRALGEIVLANFNNPNGLEQQGDNMYSTGVNSGLPAITTPAPGRRHDPGRGRGTVQRRREHEPRRFDHGLEHVSSQQPRDQHDIKLV